MKIRHCLLQSNFYSGHEAVFTMKSSFLDTNWFTYVSFARAFTQGNLAKCSYPTRASRCVQIYTRDD